MSRACCCSVSHADVTSSITTIQNGDDAMIWATSMTNDSDIVSVIEQVVGEGVVVVMVCVCVCVCVWVFVWVCVCGWVGGCWWLCG